MYKVLYPFEGTVDDKQIYSWFSDAIANGNIDSDVLDNTPLDQYELDYVIDLLQDTGKFTFGKD